MLVAAQKLLVKCLLETALIFIGVGLVFAFGAWRISRRLVTLHPDRLEKLSGPAGMLMQFLAQASGNKSSAPVESEAEDFEEVPS